MTINKNISFDHFITIIQIHLFLFLFTKCYACLYTYSVMIRGAIFIV